MDVAMAGLRGEAAIVGLVELPPERRLTRQRRFTIEQWALLAKQALDDAGLDPSSVNGVVTTRIAESWKFAPATVVEYLGIPVNFAELVDIGGASSAGMIWRAAAAIELGLCDVVLAVAPGAADSLPIPSRRPEPVPDYFGASSNAYGSPQAEFEIPFGILGQNLPYAQIAQLYGSAYGYDCEALAKIAVDQRTNACSTPSAVFHGKPITIADVLNSQMIADPHARDGDAVPGRGGCRAGAGRHRRAIPKQTCLGQRFRRVHRIQDPDVCARPA
jgi:acetyl-CoA C-acetyltransferase